MNKLLLFLLWIGSCIAADWSQFRGPHASGVDSSTALPLRWDVESGENIAWQTPIPGLAHSSPIAWKGRVYLITAIVWAHPRQGNYMQTPILVGGYIYACFDNGVVTCFDAKTGAIQYSERLSASGQGFSASPVSDGKRLFFPSETGNVLCWGPSQNSRCSPRTS